MKQTRSHLLQSAILPARSLSSLVDDARRTGPSASKGGEIPKSLLPLYQKDVEKIPRLTEDLQRAQRNHERATTNVRELRQRLDSLKKIRNPRTKEKQCIESCARRLESALKTLDNKRRIVTELEQKLLTCERSRAILEQSQQDPTSPP